VHLHEGQEYRSVLPEKLPGREATAEEYDTEDGRADFPAPFPVVFYVIACTLEQSRRLALGGALVITLADLTARVRRLEQLTRGLAKEVVLWKKCDDPLLFLERKTYLDAMQNGLANLDGARVVLAQARQRLLDGAGTIGEILGR
jgi:hypothetical protein